MRKLLITGAAGFIGSNFVHYWHQSNPEDRIFVLDALTMPATGPTQLQNDRVVHVCAGVGL